MEEKEAKWYVVHTYSGYENKVKDGIEKAIVNRHMEDLILEVLVPTQEETVLKEVTVQKNGIKTTEQVKKTVQRKLFPGYVLVNMVNNQDTWYVVRNTRGVTGFVGPGGELVPLTEAEMKPYGIKSNRVTIDFGENDVVKVVSGPWKDNISRVHKIDYNKQVVTISIDIFGRETMVEIGFAEVRKND